MTADIPARLGPAALLAASAERWLAATERRHSRRSFDGRPVPAADLAALEELAAAFAPYDGARTLVIAEAPPSIFMGIVGAYGGISDAPSAILFAGRRDVGAEAVGYTGEALVLEATARGLDTCWVGGLFDAASAAASAGGLDGDRVFAVSPLGFAQASATIKERIIFGAARAKHRRPLDTIAPGWESWPRWAQRAVEAVRIAPSATNRQPWRLALRDGALEVSYAGPDTPRVSKRLDCGIAMLHAELGARAEGVGGEWETGEDALVGRYVPAG